MNIPARAVVNLLLLSVRPAHDKSLAIVLGAWARMQLRLPVLRGWILALPAIFLPYRFYVCLVWR